jgi:hypothetical protein
MTSSHFFAGLSQRFWLQQLHFPLLVIRLSVAMILLVLLSQQQLSSSWFIVGADALVVSVGGFGVLALLCGLLLPFVPRLPQHWILATISIDVILSMSLLWLVPAQPWIGFSISIVMLIAGLIGFSAFMVIMLSVGLIMVAMMRAYLDGILQHSVATPLHLLQGIFGLIALAISQRLRVPTDHHMHQQDTETGWAKSGALFDAITYLLPYHHRNQIPLTLLMLQLPSSSTQRQCLLPMLTRFLNERLRISDVVIRYKARQVVILLCDTNEQGASVIAHSIWNEGCPAQQHLIPIAISHVPFYGVATQSILDRMEQVLQKTDQCPTDRILFVSPTLREDAK